MLPVEHRAKDHSVQLAQPQIVVPLQEVDRIGLGMEHVRVRIRRALLASPAGLDFTAILTSPPPFARRANRTAKSARTQRHALRALPTSF